MAEEKEEMNEEAKLAQEALDATPETPAEKPEFTKEAIDQITSLRTERSVAREGKRAAELQAARAQGELDALKATNAEQEKSPLQLAQEAAKEDEPVEFTPELYEAQRKFEQGQATARSEQEIYERQLQEYNAGLSTFPEREQLIAEGGHLLTEGDKRNLWDAGRNSGRELKRILTQRIEQNQPKEKPETKKKDESKKAEEKEEVPSQEEILKDKALNEEFKRLSCA